MDLTPEQLLAGQNSVPTDIVNPAAADPSASAAPAGALPMTAGGTDALSSLAPPVAQSTGVSESPQDQLRRQAMQNSDQIIANASNPNAPGAIMRAIVGGMQGALAGVGNIGKVPEGAGALYGVGKVMQARQEAQRQAKQDAAASQQQKFENDYKTQELQLRKD